MLAYGKYKRGSKFHPHNTCGVCGESKIIKNKERQKCKAEIAQEVAELTPKEGGAV